MKLPYPTLYDLVWQEKNLDLSMLSEQRYLYSLCRRVVSPASFPLWTRVFWLPHIPLVTCHMAATRCKVHCAVSRPGLYPLSTDAHLNLINKTVDQVEILLILTYEISPPVIYLL
jgi:hypothetical protein